jgi:hypothetical protein
MIFYIVCGYIHYNTVGRKDEVTRVY